MAKVKEETVVIDKVAARKKVLAALNKRFGDNTISKGTNSEDHKIEVIPTGSIGLDVALGRGGYPRGRIIEIMGYESCLDGDTFIKYKTVRPDGTTSNTKGGTLRNLYKRFTSDEPTTHRVDGRRTTDTFQPTFTAPSINEENRVVENKILDVIRIGLKEGFVVKTSLGQTIIATEDHKFFTGEEYVPLKDLDVGDTVMVHNNTHFKVEHTPKSVDRKDLYLQYHPVAATKDIKDLKTGKIYSYYRVRQSRAVMEAHLSGITLDEYINKLDNEDISGITFLPRDMHVHHKDDDCTNDAICNLEVISASEHGKLHATERHNNLRFVVVPVEIISISSVGLREVFDVKMAAPYHNFIADGFTVSNCGKTSLTLHAMAQCQRMGGAVAFVDVEQALDPEYAKKLGVNMDEVAFSQPSSAEEALEIVDMLVSSGAYDMVVVDSVAALVPQAELDAEMGKAQMGAQARLMSQAMRKLTAKVSESNCILFMINQFRQKIGVMYGPSETTPGGNALKFYASVRMEIRKGKPILEDEKNKKVLGNITHVKIIKNKVGAPFRKAEFNLIHGVGIDRLTEIFTFGVNHQLVEKLPAHWYAYNGEKIGHGAENAKEWFKSHPEELAALEKSVYESLRSNTSAPVVLEDGIGETEDGTKFDEHGEVL